MEINIGEIVQEAFKKGDLSKAEFARQIGIKSQNLKRQFESRDWEVIKLIKAGKALNHSFSYLFDLDGFKKNENPKIYLKIEVNEDNMNEVLKLIENKELYQIIKK